MITVANDGPLLASTDYWQTEHAAKGLVYMTGNARAWRMLVPAAMADQLAEIRTGLPCLIRS